MGILPQYIVGAAIPTLITAMDGHGWVEFPPSPAVCVNGARNVALLSAIMVGGEIHSASRLLDLNFSKIPKK